MSPTLTRAVRTSTDAARRLSARRGAAILSAIVTLTYAWMFFAIRTAETGLSENTFGAYLQLTVIYTIGTVLLLVTDHRWLWGIGAAVQVIVLALFATFGIAIFDYSAVADLPLALWAATITTAQLLVLGLLGYLALSPTPTPSETT